MNDAPEIRTVRFFEKTLHKVSPDGESYEIKRDFVEVIKTKDGCACGIERMLVDTEEKEDPLKEEFRKEWQDYLLSKSEGL